MRVRAALAQRREERDGVGVEVGELLVGGDGQARPLPRACAFARGFAPSRASAAARGFAPSRAFAPYASVALRRTSTFPRRAFEIGHCSSA